MELIGSRTLSEKDRFKLMGGQFLLVITLIVNLITTVTVLLVVNKLGLKFGTSANTTLGIVSDSNSNELGNLFRIYKDVEVETLLLDNYLSFESINNEQILITSGGDAKSQFHPMRPKTEIFLSQDFISMQAASFKAGPDSNDLNLRINREVDELQVSGISRNIRSIRSRHQTRSTEGEHREKDTTGSIRNNNLHVESGDDELELSGNLGLFVHGKDVELRSKKGIVIDSKENVIDIRSAAGLFMPNVGIFDGESSQVTDFILEHQDGISQHEEEVSKKRRQLRINKFDGLLSQARM